MEMLALFRYRFEKPARGIQVNAEAEKQTLGGNCQHQHLIWKRIATPCSPYQKCQADNNLNGPPSTRRVCVRHPSHSPTTCQIASWRWTQGSDYHYGVVHTSSIGRSRATIVRIAGVRTECCRQTMQETMKDCLSNPLVVQRKDKGCGVSFILNSRTSGATHL